MATESRPAMKPWMEVAPSLLECPWKHSNTPKLETIFEDKDEELDGEEDGLAGF